MLPPPAEGGKKSPINIDYKKYEDNLLTGVVAVVLGFAYKTVMRSEIVPVSSAKKALLTFAFTSVCSIVGEEIVDQLKSIGYL